jgi:YgiT-type zinc finger domain-containing protein
MKCVICNQGNTRPGTATVTLTRDLLTLVVKSVPAQVCENCGEEYVDDETSQQLLAAAEEASRAGVQVDVREYTAA